jgi:hypothetical protein
MHLTLLLILRCLLFTLALSHHPSPNVTLEHKQLLEPLQYSKDTAILPADSPILEPYRRFTAQIITELESEMAQVNLLDVELPPGTDQKGVNNLATAPVNARMHFDQPQDAEIGRRFILQNDQDFHVKDIPNHGTAAFGMKESAKYYRHVVRVILRSSKNKKSWPFWPIWSKDNSPKGKPCSKERTISRLIFSTSITKESTRSWLLPLDQYNLSLLLKSPAERLSFLTSTLEMQTLLQPLSWDPMVVQIQYFNDNLPDCPCSRSVSRPRRRNNTICIEPSLILSTQGISIPFQSPRRTCNGWHCYMLG